MDHKATCLVCNETVAVLKQYNLRRLYETKYLSAYSKFSGKLRFEKYESMKCGLETQRNLFKRMFVGNESVTRTSYKIVQTMTELDGKLIKECMMQAINDLCPEKADLFWKYQSFNKFSCVENRRTRGEYNATDTRESKKLVVVFYGAR